MSTTEFARKVVSMVRQSQPSTTGSPDFEMAYQAKVAAERIRFAIRQIDEESRRVAQIRDAATQLLDALDRLESVDRRFQDECRRASVGLAQIISPDEH